MKGQLGSIPVNLQLLKPPDDTIDQASCKGGSFPFRISGLHHKEGKEITIHH